MLYRVKLYGNDGWCVYDTDVVAHDAEEAKSIVYRWHHDDTSVIHETIMGGDVYGL